MQIWTKKSVNGRLRLRYDQPLGTVAYGSDTIPGGPWLSVSGIGSDYIEYRIRLSVQDLKQLVFASDRYHRINHHD